MSKLSPCTYNTHDIRIIFFLFTGLVFSVSQKSPLKGVNLDFDTKTSLLYSERSVFGILF